jgi:hypothetical protein
MKKKKNILTPQCMNFVENLIVIKLANKFPDHKSSPLLTLSHSLKDPFQYFSPIYTYTFTLWDQNFECISYFSHGHSMSRLSHPSLI